MAFAACSSDQTPAGGSGATTSTGGSNAPGTGGSPSTVTGGSNSGPGTGGFIAAMGGNGTTPGTGGSSTTGGSGSSTGGSSSSTGGTATSGGSAGSGSGGTSSTTGVTVKLDGVHQTIQGFGLNDALLSATWSTQTLDNLFTTNGADAIGLQVLRIGMNSSLQGGINGSTQSNISGAKSRGAKIIGSVWSPPASCKSNNNTKDGGHVLTSCYASWSDAIAKFAKDNNLYAMSLGNEPDFASCGDAEPCNGSYDTTLYTAKEMVAFAKVAGPKLQANGVKVIAPEASEWIHTWSNESAKGSVPGNKNSSDPLKCGFPASNTACTMGDGYDYGHWLNKDADAWKAIDIIGVHEYDTQHAEPWPADVSGGKKDKEVWQTEMSGVKWWPEQGTGTGSSLTGSDTIDNGVAVAGWIHSALVVGEASAWLWWWYNAYNTDDNEGLLLGKSGTKLTRRYYALGNYSKFVRPTYQMVDVTGNSNTDVLLSAFKGPDGTVVVVAINKGAAAATIPIAITGGTAPAMMTPNVTSATDNLKAGSPVAVSGGSFMASLPSKTITTFVGK